MDLAIVGAAGVGIAGAAAFGVGAYYGAEWVIHGPLGPSYPLPEEYDPFGIGATYALPESSTIFVDSTVLYALPKGVQSMADHLGFLFGYGTAGMPGFPNPFDRHDPKKGNDPRTNGRHIRNALEGIRKNLGNQDLRTHLHQILTDDQYISLTQDLDYLVTNLQEQGWFYEQLGADLSSDILSLLEQMGYIVG